MTERKIGLVIANDYKGTAMSLDYTENDAIEIKKALEDPNYKFEIEPLINKNFKEVGQKIQDILDDADQTDTVLIYVSGHGKLNNESDLYLMFNDTQPKYLETSSLGFEYINRWIKKSRCQNIITILDCCYSGAADCKGGDIEKKIEEKLEAVACGSGKIILTSSTKYQPSKEDPKLMHGVFTYYLLEGFKCEEVVNEHGYVTIDRLYQYAYEKTCQRNPDQTPLLKGVFKGEIIIGKNTLKEKFIKARLPMNYYKEALKILNYEDNETLTDIEMKKRQLLRKLLEDKIPIDAYIEICLQEKINELSNSVKQMDELVISFGKQNIRPSNRKDMKDSINFIQPNLQSLQNKLECWGIESKYWIKNFHIHLDKYHHIYATDVYRRSSITSPQFEKYLREQYAVRLRGLKTNSNHCIGFSEQIYDAIMFTGWEPDPNMWRNTQIVKSTNCPGENIEIVRILIRPPVTWQDCYDLENLDFDHRLFAIPLFVIDYQSLQQVVDFAIGLNEDGKIVRCYEFFEKDSDVCEVVDHHRRLNLKEMFEDMLRNPLLRTVGQFITHGVMITDPEKAKFFAANYDQERKASSILLDIIRKNINPNQNNGKVGVDIGCGTGNYTIPFIKNFDKIYGIDIDKFMLDIARTKSNKVEWIERNVLKTLLPNQHCDAVWSISTLHYFNSGRQDLLFREIYRILKPGGIFVADTEFEEQHDSLWVVKFFPSLRYRFEGKILSIENYKTMFKEIGFSDFRHEELTYQPTENDVFLRIGQHDPKRYLESKVREANPAFKEMIASELEEGIRKLEAAISDGTINDIIVEYEKKARMKGDLGIIIATR